MNQIDFLRRKSAESQSEAVRFDLRDYQIRAARSALRLLSRMRNVVVDLPTGAGKTNVALISSALVSLSTKWLVKKILYIVPTRILIDQVSRAARWLDPEIYRIAIRPELTANRFALNAAIHRAQLIITTPGLFASLLRSGAVDRDWFSKSLALTVVDEFDEFLTIDATRTGFRARFEDAFGNLVKQIPERPYLLMSGTAPKMAKQVVKSESAQLFADFIDERFAPVTLRISEQEYKDFIPKAIVHFISITDSFVSDCNLSLNYQQQRAFIDFRCSEGIDLDIDYLMERLNVLARGLVTSVRLRNGKLIPVTPSIVSLSWRLLAIVQKYTFLFEDMFSDFDIDIRRAKVEIDCDDYRLMDLPFLIDRRRTNEYWPQLRGKSQALLNLVSQRIDERGVIFTRNVRLSDALQELFNQYGIPVLELDGRLSDKKRFEQIHRFNKLSYGVLIITRTTGKRGLDIPKADYAVLYSPKEDEYVMWQELSRIRSTLSCGKDSYVLYYDSTAEHEKLLRLRSEMEHSANSYEFVEETA